MNAHPTPLKYLSTAWFSVVMGLAGLSLAWHRAGLLMGDMAVAVAWGLAGLAAAAFALLVGASLVRARRHLAAWTEDLHHPVRHPFVAAIPVSLLLLATVAVALLGASPAARALWWLGSLGQLTATGWVVARWWRGNQAGGLLWVGVTPALLIPIVGNVLAPLAGVQLGHGAWASAQLGVGLMFWPAVLVLIIVRLATVGPWPERLRPAAFILIAPPAVVGLALLQLGAPLGVAWALWGMAVFCLVWAATQLKAIASQPFGVPHWAMSFPLAAVTALTLRMAQDDGALVALAMALLALTTLVVAALALGTLRGLRDGSLLAPEPVAMIQPVSA